VLKNGGEVIGVNPEGLVEKEFGFIDLTDLRVVPSIHKRKALMAVYRMVLWFFLEG